MTMVEQVVKALAAVVGRTGGCYSDACCCSGVEAFECKTGLDIEDIARAAIEAMREPTEAMYEAGSFYASSPKRTWETMIDEALKTTTVDA